jgi:hypothetical protein
LDEPGKKIDALDICCVELRACKNFHFLPNHKLRDMSDSLLGPKYDYTNELAAPSEIGVRAGGSFDDVMGAMAGFNYYIDAIGFGQSTGMAKSRGLQNQRLGIRYFMKTGMKCSNNADMHEYIDTVPKGLPGRAGKEAQKTLGVELRGLAPGIVEDAASALNPVRLFTAAMGTGYAQCKKVTLPVGDERGRLASPYDGAKWVEGPVEYKGGVPHQTRWVFDKDISQEAFDKTPKIESFSNIGEGPAFQTIAAGVLLAALAVGVAVAVQRR